MAGSHTACGRNGNQDKGCRRKFPEQELLEVSAVSIPANFNALTLGLKAGAIQKSDLKDLPGAAGEGRARCPPRAADSPKPSDGALGTDAPYHIPIRPFSPSSPQRRRGGPSLFIPDFLQRTAVDVAKRVRGIFSYAGIGIAESSEQGGHRRTGFLAVYILRKPSRRSNPHRNPGILKGLRQCRDNQANRFAKRTQRACRMRGYDFIRVLKTCEDQWHRRTPFLTRVSQRINEIDADVMPGILNTVCRRPQEKLWIDLACEQYSRCSPRHNSISVPKALEQNRDGRSGVGSKEFHVRYSSLAHNCLFASQGRDQSRNGILTDTGQAKRGCVCTVTSQRLVRLVQQPGQLRDCSLSLRAEYFKGPYSPTPTIIC